MIPPLSRHYCVWAPIRMHATPAGRSVVAVGYEFRQFQGNSETSPLESGANPDSIRGDGSSALLLAIDNSFYDLADLMIRKGANPALINDHGSYPLLRAVERGQFELVKSMRSRGASLDIQDAHGLTAPHATGWGRARAGSCRAVRSRNEPRCDLTPRRDSINTGDT